jgi:hypothetical protein
VVVGSIPPPCSRHKESLAAVIRGVISGRMVLQRDQRRRNLIPGGNRFLRLHSSSRLFLAACHEKARWIGSDHAGSVVSSGRTLFIGAWMPSSRFPWSQEAALLTELLSRRVRRVSQCLKGQFSGMPLKREDSGCPSLRMIPLTF